MMTRNEPTRTMIIVEIDELDWSIEALSAQLSLPEEKRVSRLQNARQRLSEVLDHVKAEIARAETLAQGKKAELDAAVDELKVQLALGQAEVEESLETQRQRFDRAVAEFEASTRTELVRLERSLEQYYEHARDRLRAELNAAAIRVREEKAHAGAAFTRRQAELRAELERHKLQLQAERQKREEKWHQFHQEVGPAIRQIGDAFNRLLHP